MYTHKRHLLIPLICSIAILLVVAFAFATPLFAQESTVVFPVTELGNCESKEACRTYCDTPGNMKKCIAFAQAHNLMTPEEAEKAEKFSGTLEQQGGGPGACTTPSECRAYCEDVTHLNECLTFAEDNGHQDEFVEEGRKIARYLESGGQMPGGCTSRQSCEAYCSDFNHAEECFSFAEKAGLEDGDEERQNGPNKEHIRAMIDLVKKGETPGNCTSPQSCEAYCSSGDHIEECVAFGEKVGFLSSEDAQRVRKTGGRGPGGCSSPQECDQFCNNPSNREQCLAFAEENGFIGKDERQNLEQGVSRLKEVLANAPKEAQECLRKNLGTNIIETIESGAVTPGPAFAQKVEACLKKGFDDHSQKQFVSTLNNMPPEVRSCIEEKVGGKVEEIFARGGEQNGLEQVVRGCFEASRPAFGNPDGNFDDNFDDQLFRREERARVFHTDDNQNRDFNNSSTQGGAPATFRPEMEKCALDRFGSDFKEKLALGELNPEDFKRSTEECVRNQTQSATEGEQFDRPFDRGVPQGDFNEDFQNDEFLKRDNFEREFDGEFRDDFNQPPPLPPQEFHDEFTEPREEFFEGETREFRTFDGTTEPFDSTQSFDEVQQFEEFKDDFKTEEFHQEPPPPDSTREGTTESFEPQPASGKLIGSVLNAVKLFLYR